jgi:AraC-like DNA-binding protein
MAVRRTGQQQRCQGLTHDVKQYRFLRRDPRVPAFFLETAPAVSFDKILPHQFVMCLSFGTFIPMQGHESVPDFGKHPLPTMTDTIRQSLESHFREKKPFLKNGYSIRDLSTELGIPIHQLSQFINKKCGKNFNEWINEFRVDHFRDHLSTDPNVHHYTVEALGQMSGFQSRNAFITAMKRRTGSTPSEMLGRRSKTSK